MRICVVGAGLAGLTSAHRLAADGHEVVVVDHATAVGRGTSRANGGQLSYSYVAPLAAPGVVAKGIGWLLDADAPMRLRPQADPRLLRWLWQFARASRREAFEANTRDMLVLARHSRRILGKMMAEEDLAFSYRQNGKLVVFRSEGELAAAADLVAYQARHGAKQEVLDAKGCLALEPALRDVAGRIAGGVHTPDEAVGDALQFCEALQRSLARNPDVTFRLGTAVTSVEAVGGRVRALRTPKGAIEADHYVLANGIGALATTEPLGMRLPIYPSRATASPPPSGQATSRRRSASPTRTARSSTRRSAVLAGQASYGSPAWSTS